MLLFALSTLCTIVLSRAIDENKQLPLTAVELGGLENTPGGSIVKLCSESRDTDILDIIGIVNVPQIPYLNEEIDVEIFGIFGRDISVNSTVDYQISATANNGDSDTIKGTFHICDYLEKMHQPPNSSVPEKACPPSNGPVFIDYAFWFANFLVAPGNWSVKFDAKTPEGDRIYCLETVFDLQCRPGYDGPECLRGEHNGEKVKLDWMMQK